MKSTPPNQQHPRRPPAVISEAPVTAGFPVPAGDHIQASLDLEELLIKHPAATFFIRVVGDSMIGAGIHPGDILVVDRSLEAADRNVIIAIINGELTVKRLRTGGDTIRLVPENDAYRPLEVTDQMEFEVWGVVTSVIHAL